MATRVPKPKSLEEVQQLMNQLEKHKATLQEDARKTDTQRKIIKGGSVGPVIRINPVVSLLWLIEANKVISNPRDRKIVEEHLPGGSTWNEVVAAVKSGPNVPLKTLALEALTAMEVEGDPVKKPAPKSTVSEAKPAAPVAEKPVGQTPIAGEKLGGSVEKNRAENGVGPVGSWPFAAEEKAVGTAPSAVGKPLQSLGLFGPKTPAAGASTAAD
jgi:hypothetical protein